MLALLFRSRLAFSKIRFTAISAPNFAQTEISRWEILFVQRGHHRCRIGIQALIELHGVPAVFSPILPILNERVNGYLPLSDLRHRIENLRKRPEFPSGMSSGCESDYSVMGVAAEAGTVRPVRRWRSVSEKRQIVQLTLEPGASVALIARAHGVNANQVFKWRRALERGELIDPAAASTALLPVTLSLRVKRPANGELGAKEQPTSAARSISSFLVGR